MTAAERLVAPHPPARDRAPALPKTDPGSHDRNTVLGRILFVVRDDREAPVPAVLIHLRSTSGEETALTGSAGEALFDGLAAGPYAYQIEAPGRPALAAASVELAEGEGRVLELRLGDYDRSIEGRILDQDGEPVAGLTVTARPYSGRPGADSLVAKEQRGESAADGWFEITGLDAGEHELRSLATGRYASARTIVRAGTDSAVLSVNERRERRVRGQVTDQAGKPLAAVEVSLLWGQGRRTRTDEAGWYALAFEDAGPDGRRRLRFDLTGYRPEHLALDAAAPRREEAVRLDARLEPVGQTLTVLAYLMDQEGAPVVGETIQLHSRQARTHYRGTSDRTGAIVFPAVLPSADYRLSVLPNARYRTVEWPFLDLTVEPPPLEIVLEPLSTGRLTGRMVDVTGRPVPHFSLWLHSNQAEGRWIKVTGDGSGSFDVKEVPEGHLTLQTRSQPWFRTSGIELGAGSEADVEIVLDRGGHLLEGQVVDEKGAPLAGARIRLDWLGEDWPVAHHSSRQAVADGAGAFLFSRLGGGPYGLRAEAPGRVAERLSLDFGAAWARVRLKPVK